MDNETYYDYLVKRSRFSFAFRDKVFIQSLTHYFTGRVLDVGCGIGEFLKAYPGEVIGVDINPLLVKYCQDKGFAGAVAGAFPACRALVPGTGSPHRPCSGSGAVLYKAAMIRGLFFVTHPNRIIV